ncbi:MAG: LamG-like jellyroll fold domain-containing protein [Limisphaerales bacterium]
MSANRARGNPCLPAPSGLVGWWSAEGSASNQIAGSSGTLAGNASYGPGEVGQGFIFDGNGDGVALGSPASLQLQNFTIETWIKRASTTVVSYGSGGNGTIFSYGTGAYYFGIGAAGFLFFSQAGNPDYVTGPYITDTNFHHVAVTKVGSTVVFYMDGVAYPAAAYDVTFTFSNGSPAIGYWGENGDSGFLGTLDELSIYNRALSLSEIQAIYNAGDAGKCYTPAAPVITSQPTNLTVVVGRPASFTISASGTPPLSYQWRFNVTNIISGATNNALFLPTAQFTNAGIYSVSVGNGVDSILSSNAVLTVNPPPPCIPAPSGLVGWWTAEGNALNQMTGSSGTLAGNASYGPGEVGQGFIFDGNGDGVALGSPISLQLQNFTIEAWIKRNSTASVSASDPNAWFFGYNNNGYGFGLWNDGKLYLTKAGVSDVKGNTSITDTSFHHVAVTKNGNTVVFYVDGVGYPPVVYNAVFSFTTSVGIGYIAGSSSCSFLGMMDEVSVYNRPLSASEVQGIYLAGSEGKCFMPIPPHTATGTATLAGGFIVDATITDTGYGYTNTPLVRFIGGGGSGAQAVAVVSNGVVIAINMINAGSGYTNTPVVVIDPPFITNPVLSIASISFLSFSSLTVNSNYQLQQFQPPVWTNQSASFKATNANYTQVVPGVVSSGDYRLVRTPFPTQASATAQLINGFVIGAIVTSGGSGYSTPPAVTIVANVGSNATATASVSGGRVTAININSAGSGYVSPVTIQIDPPPVTALSPSVTSGVALNASSLAPYNNYQLQFKSNLFGAWGNWSGTPFIPTAETNYQNIFVTNNAGFFRLLFVP